MLAKIAQHAAFRRARGGGGRHGGVHS
jgi:hypothetical protein